MTDEQKKQGEGEAKTSEDNGGGDRPESASLIDDANKAAERLERANKEKALLLAREEQLAAKRALGGTTEGTKPQEKPRPLTPKEYADQLSKGKVPIDYQ